MIVGLGGMTVGLTSIFVTVWAVNAKMKGDKRFHELAMFYTARDKFQKEMMSFYHFLTKHVRELETGTAVTNVILDILPRQLATHRKLIDEFRFSVPEHERGRFDSIANKYCPPYYDYEKYEFKEKYGTSEATEEAQLRRNVLADLESLLWFSI
jgi:hypothetical protein